MKRFEGFVYQIPDSVCRLVGKTPQQIINTLKFYQGRGRGYESWKGILIPSKGEISPVESISVTCSLPLAKVDHNIEVKLMENFEFFINANAYDFVIQQAKKYEQLRRGDLYKFVAGLDMLGFWFLPEEIMKALKTYNWDQHLRQINTWMAQRETDLDEAERRGFLKRVR